MQNIQKVVNLAEKAIEATERAAEKESQAEGWRRSFYDLQRDVREWAEENLEGDALEDLTFLVNDR